MKKIGLFGGTFNPIHIGHLRVALEIKEAFDLERVHLIPSAIPPHKCNQNIAHVDDRLEMVRLVALENDDFDISDVEINRKGPSYTIDTVKCFTDDPTQKIRFYLIMGLDAFMEIETWKAYSDLFKEISVIVMLRPEPESGLNPNLMNVIKDHIHDKISTDYHLVENRHSNGCFEHHRLKPIYIHHVTLLDISSTKIRNLIKSGHSIRYLVPGSVEHYILTKRLYT